MHIKDVFLNGPYICRNIWNLFCVFFNNGARFRWKMYFRWSSKVKPQQTNKYIRKMLQNNQHTKQLI